jgi:hypothetical protein
VRDFFATLTVPAGNTSASAAWLKGTPGADVVSFASEAALAARRRILGNAGSDCAQALASTSTKVNPDSIAWIDNSSANHSRLRQRDRRGLDSDEQPADRGRPAGIINLAATNLMG